MLGITLSLLAGVGFGTTAVFARLGLQHIHTTPVTLISLMMSTVIALAIALGFYFQEIFGLSDVVFFWFIIADILTSFFGRLRNDTGVHLVGVSSSTQSLVPCSSSRILHSSA